MTEKNGRKANDKIYRKKTMEEQLEEEKGMVRGVHGGPYSRWGTLWDWGQGGRRPVRRIKCQRA